MRFSSEVFFVTVFLALLVYFLTVTLKESVYIFSKHRKLDLEGFFCVVAVVASIVLLKNPLIDILKESL